jgi:putative nucleotidyltransferase with HDIG domain
LPPVPVRPSQTHIGVLAEEVALAESHQEIFRAVFLFSARVTPADSMFVALFDADTKLRRCVYAASLAVAAHGERVLEEDDDLSIYPLVGLNRGPQSQAIQTGEVVNTPDLASAVQGLARFDTGSDFDEKPPLSSVAVPLKVSGKVIGAFEVQSARLAAFADEHLPYLKMAARLAAIAAHNLELRERERAQHEGILRALGLVLEHRDYETKGHTDRVVELTLALAESLGLDPDARQHLRWGAYLHDVGKIAVADRILLKPGPLSEEEYEAIKRHTLVGLDICNSVPFLPAQVKEVVKSHHERWNGTGYPDGLRGDAIPLGARIFALVDVYDALTHERPYKAAWTHERAVEHIHGQRGGQFDPELTPIFLALVPAVPE